MGSTKKRAPAKRARRMDLSDASTPLYYAEPVPATAKAEVTGADLGFDRRTGVSFRMADLMDELAQRVTLGLAPSEVVRRDLQRYYAICDAERVALTAEWTVEEWAALRAALSGATFSTPKHLRTMWAYAAEAFGMEHVVTRTLRGAPLGSLYALLDAMESMPDLVPAAAEEEEEEEERTLVAVSACGPDGVEQVGA